MIIKSLSEDDFIAHAGHSPERSMRGLTFVEDNEIKGIVYTARIMGNQWLMLSINDKSFTMRRALILGWEIIRYWISSPLYVEKTQPEAESLIKHFGFKHLHEDIWVWDQHSPTLH